MNTVIKSNRHQIHSPNDWIVKAGAYVDENSKMHMPLQCILAPMTQASEHMEAYKSATNYGDQSKAILAMALSVRIADKAYFADFTNLINSQTQGGVGVCETCLRKAVSPQLVKLRREVNQHVIHKMEKGLQSMIHPSHFQVAIDYYATFLSLPLMKFTDHKHVKITACEKCHLVKNTMQK